MAIEISLATWIFISLGAALILGFFLGLMFGLPHKKKSTANSMDAQSIMDVTDKERAEAVADINWKKLRKQNLDWGEVTK